MSSTSDGDSRVVIRATWESYQAIAAGRGDRPAPRLSYRGGELELRGPSYHHESLASRVRTFVLMVARGMGRPCLDAGSTRWEREDLDAGKEPDGCFYLAHEPRVRGRETIDLQVDPPPDLALEIEFRHRQSSRDLAIYASLGVPEVWRYDGDTLQFLSLSDTGAYVESESSRNFPTLRVAAALAQLSAAATTDQATWSGAVEAWARGTLKLPG
jgi:Uma2 family endonuclease